MHLLSSRVSRDLRTFSTGNFVRPYSVCSLGFFFWISSSLGFVD